MLFWRITVSQQLSMPAPPVLAVLPVIVLLLIVTTKLSKMPPPKLDPEELLATFSLTVLLVIVSVP